MLQIENRHPNGKTIMFISYNKNIILSEHVELWFSVSNWFNSDKRDYISMHSGLSKIQYIQNEIEIRKFIFC